jgi:hypothetical protein
MGPGYVFNLECSVNHKSAEMTGHTLKPHKENQILGTNHIIFDNFSMILL